MIITNKHNMPEPLFAVLAGDRFEYDPELIHVTELVAPVQQTVLKRRWWDRLEEDASDRLWALLGTSVHVIAEMWDKPGVLKEHNIVTEEIAGLRVTGTIDIIDPDPESEADIYDYKTTSAFTIKMGSRAGDNEKQLNLYAALARREDHTIERAMILSIVRDHMASQAWKDDYPDIPVHWEYVTMWDAGIAEDFLQDRVRAVAMAMEHPDKPLIECTKEERWNRGSGNRRCQGYCVARPVCRQMGVTVEKCEHCGTPTFDPSTLYCSEECELARGDLIGKMRAAARKTKFKSPAKGET